MHGEPDISFKPSLFFHRCFSEGIESARIGRHKSRNCASDSLSSQLFPLTEDKPASGTCGNATAVVSQR